jgi:hypothetical protein
MDLFFTITFIVGAFCSIFSYNLTSNTLFLVNAAFLIILASKGLIKYLK